MPYTSRAGPAPQAAADTPTIEAFINIAGTIQKSIIKREAL